MAFETEDSPSVEERAFTVMFTTEFVPQTWDGWSHSLGNNDKMIESMHDRARLVFPITAFQAEFE